VTKMTEIIWTIAKLSNRRRDECYHSSRSIEHFYKKKFTPQMKLACHQRRTIFVKRVRPGQILKKKMDEIVWKHLSRQTIDKISGPPFHSQIRRFNEDLCP
jgi:hypothetical protein